MGMSAEAVQGQQGQPAGTDPTSQPAGGEPQGQQQSQDTGLYSEFIKGVPDSHKPIVDPYVRQWDAQVTRRFQDLHSQLKPYQEFGPPEQVAQAVQLLELLNTQPETVLRVLQETLGEPQPYAGMPAQPPVGYPQPPVQPQVPQGWQQPQPGYQQPWPQQQPQAPQGLPQQQFQLPPEIQQQIESQNRLVQAMARWAIEQDRQRQVSQQDTALEQELAKLKEKHGEYDEDYVLMLIENGYDGDAAVQAWNQRFQEHVNRVNGVTRKTPPILSGGGAVPNDQGDPSKMDRTTLRSTVANLIAKAQSEGT